MEDRYLKYSKLSGAISLLFIGFIAALAVIVIAVRLLFGLFDAVPWLAYIYMGFVVAAPALLFISVFIIFFKRTLSYEGAAIKYICLFIFGIIILLWVFTLGADMITFFKKFYPDAAKYRSYGFWMLVGSVLTIFVTGLLQAMGTEKEKDWLEKRREREMKEKDGASA